MQPPATSAGICFHRKNTEKSLFLQERFGSTFEACCVLEVNYDYNEPEK